MERTHEQDCGWERLDPSAWDRIRARTRSSVNQRIDGAAAARVARLQREPTASLLRRLAELDREWDVDRALMANFALLGGSSFALGLSRAPRSRARSGWLGLFGAQLGFLLVHAVVGWSPPLPVFRRLGFRTQKEIDVERHCVERLLRERNAQMLGSAAEPIVARQ